MKKILIVDDSISVRKALERILGARDNFDVRTADSAEVALELVKAEVPDLIIADIVMPGMDGFELCRTVKQKAEHSKLPILLISGLVTPDVEAQTREAGAVGVVKKPFSPEDFFPKLDLAFAQAAQAEPSHEEAKPLASPQVSIRSQHDIDSLSQVFESLLEKDEVESVLLMDKQGQMVASLGDNQGDDTLLSQYFKFMLSASSILGEHLQAENIETLTIEYQQKTVLVKKGQGSLMLIAIMKEAGALGAIKYLLRKQLPEAEAVLAVA